jgi:hypothetical protein
VFNKPGKDFIIFVTVLAWNVSKNYQEFFVTSSSVQSWIESVTTWTGSASFSARNSSLYQIKPDKNPNFFLLSNFLFFGTNWLILRIHNKHLLIRHQEIQTRGSHIKRIGRLRILPVTLQWEYQLTILQQVGQHVSWKG